MYFLLTLFLEIAELFLTEALKKNKSNQSEADTQHGKFQLAQIKFRKVASH